MVKQTIPQVEAQVGIGLIHLNTYNNIPVYNSAHDVQPIDSILFIDITSGKDKGITKISMHLHENLLKPYMISFGDSDEAGEDHQMVGLIQFAPYLCFRVLEKLPHGALVMLNEDTYESGFIKLDPSNDYRMGSENPEFFDPNFIDTKVSNWYYYETWEQALKRAYLISLTAKTQIYEQPNGKVILLDRIEELGFRVEAIQGDWAHITNKQFQHEGDPLVTGWVRWKLDNQMKIHMMLNGGYE